ncbi:hypothetical protein A0H81_11656 [Grifola frondosa]|uniref:Uncharacterized protein n=1 Tax=Grifola frondosa TaxID=5627 RepID=A0A1C7LVA7_GRIFR|nr:hypothetical protein A0H81_11656 [Grifola frondosa]
MLQLLWDSVYEQYGQRPSLSALSYKTRRSTRWVAYLANRRFWTMIHHMSHAELSVKRNPKSRRMQDPHRQSWRERYLLGAARLHDTICFLHSSRPTAL